MVHDMRDLVGNAILAGVRLYDTIRSISEVRGVGNRTNDFGARSFGLGNSSGT